MWKLTGAVRNRLFSSLLTAVTALCLALPSHAQSPDDVATHKDDSGWKLQVNGKDFYVKGVVWGYTPIGDNYAYSLWAQSDEYIKKVVDYECRLMKNAGINTIRSFSQMPPKWVAYIYKEYGIMTILNHLMGRYGYNVGGLWRPVTDYSDRLTRETLTRDVVEWVQKYKDTPGVLLFALGNESNYGLEWSSYEIENLPVGERNRTKARHLYTLFNEIIREGKKIDSRHPFSIVNGDIQYIDLIAEYCKDLDVLGVNSYRGISFTELWKDARQKLGLPVLLMEFGSDAYNAVEQVEDQAAQARFLKAQWQELYNKSYGKGEEANSVGGCVFEWRDEWWKYRQTENLHVQDRVASWSNGGYSFDYVEGQNNMNEEWFGLCRLGRANADGVYAAEPRMAYDVLAEIWHIDLYNRTKDEMNQSFHSLDLETHALKSDVRLLKSESRERSVFSLTGGSLSGLFVVNGLDSRTERDGQDGLGFSDGEMVFLNFGFQPRDNINGNFSLNVLGNVANRSIEPIYYGSRGRPLLVEGGTADPVSGVVVGGIKSLDDRERVEIYDFSATWNTKYFDFSAFHHVPRYHWKYEGDYFGLLREATDMGGMDVWNAKAPSGVEFDGKQLLDGLKVVVGPEVYWGANPKVIGKYTFGTGHFRYALLHSEDLARTSDAATSTSATTPRARQTTLYAKTDIIPRTTVEVAGIMANSQKIGDEFDYKDGGHVKRDDIRFSDTLGVSAKVSLDVLDRARVYVAGNYAGLVADGGEPLKEFGTELPYSEYGNKVEVEGGALLNFDPVTIYPRLLYRKNLIDANPVIRPTTEGTTLYPGIVPRNRDDDPFAVLDNRECVSGELLVTYDPTPATPFYAWDNDKREDAAFAMNFGANFTKYTSITDAYLFYYQPDNKNAAFSEGLAEQNVWKALSRIVVNPTHRLKLVTKLEAGVQQSSGSPDGDARHYYELDVKVEFDKKHTLSGYVKKDAWGPYDFDRQFNITYPYQYKLDYSVRMDEFSQKYFPSFFSKDERSSSVLGLRGFYRKLDKNSPANEFDGGKNHDMTEIDLYYSFAY